jgi:hypothetical protein
MRHRIKSHILAAVAALGLAGHAFAGPVEDADAAIRRGDVKAADALLRPLAERGDVRAQSLLGAVLIAPGPTQDYPQAAIWYRKAADHGDSAAQMMLGGLYAMGQGVAADPAQAAVWFRKAADQGSPEAQTALAMQYAEGQGVTQDLPQAFLWFQKGADQGFVPAQINLGLMYQNGAGVPHDDVRALMWLDLAVTGASSDYGPMAQAAHDKVAAAMTAPQIADAKKLADAWTAHHGAAAVKR